MNTLNIGSMPVTQVTESTAYSASTQDVKVLQAHSPASGNIIPLKAQPTVATTDSHSKQSDQLSDAVQKMNKMIQSLQRELQFSIDDASGRTVIVVRDAETQEIIRQIPPEEALSLADKLGNQRLQEGDAKGLLVEKKV